MIVDFESFDGTVELSHARGNGADVFVLTVNGVELSQVSTSSFVGDVDG